MRRQIERTTVQFSHWLQAVSVAQLALQYWFPSQQLMRDSNVRQEATGNCRRHWKDAASVDISSKDFSLEESKTWGHPRPCRQMGRLKQSRMIKARVQGSVLASYEFFCRWWKPVLLKMEWGPSCRGQLQFPLQDLSLYKEEVCFNFPLFSSFAGNILLAMSS